MATNVYEGMFILDSNRYARDANAVSSGISQIVEKCGGEMLVSRLWNEQRLAYPIDGHRKGTYWLTYFKLDSTKQPELNRACQLNENILRSLVLKVDERLVEALVAHATSSSESRRPVAVGAEAGGEGGVEAKSDAKED